MRIIVIGATEKNVIYQGFLRFSELFYPLETEFLDFLSLGLDEISDYHIISSNRPLFIRFRSSGE